MPRPWLEWPMPRSRPRALACDCLTGSVAGGSNPDVMLAVNLGLSLLVMYVAMFAMIWTCGEFIQNVNFFYMALVM
jgi:hypothetical protein